MVFLDFLPGALFKKVSGLLHHILRRVIFVKDEIFSNDYEDF